MERTTPIGLLAILLLCASLAAASPHPTYDGFAQPLDTYTLDKDSLAFASLEDTKTLTITAQDHFIYSTAYISRDSQSWQPLTLSGNSTGQGWISQTATTTITNQQPASFRLTSTRTSTNDNYLIIYSCSRSTQGSDASPGWDCHDGWQIKQFSTTLEEQAASWRDGLASWWKLDGNAQDSTGDNNGIVSGATPSGSDCAAGSCYRFDGTNDFFRTGKAMSLGAASAVTASLWVKKQQFTDDDRILSELSEDFNGVSDGFVITLDSGEPCAGNIQVGIRGTTGYNVKCYSRPASQSWHHYAIVLDKTKNAAGEINLYIDGSLQAPTSQPYASDNIGIFGDRSLYVGSRSGSKMFFSGSVDEAMAWNRALSSSEIAALYANFSYTPPSCTDTCNSLGYQCGTHTICGASVSCGTCTSGICDSTGQCVASCTPSCTGKQCGSDGCGGSCGTCSLAHATSSCNATYQCAISSCSSGYGNCNLISSDGCETSLTTTSDCGSCGHSCGTGQTCTNYACTTGTVEEADYYVATNGNDNNPGTISQPWASWEKAFTSTAVQSGDTVYIRGGVYHPKNTNGDGMSVTRSGTANNWITYANYPGEVPIMDFSNVDPKDTGYNYGISLSTGEGANYVKFKGLTIRNIFQKYSYSPPIECSGLTANNGYFIFENCVMYNVQGEGFNSYFYNGWPDADGEHHFINCDSYNNSDLLSIGQHPGNVGSGFIAWNWYGTEGHTYYTGCRAWNNGDQGFSGGDNYIEYNNCWSMGNGQLEGEGHGFKLGWVNHPYNGVRKVVKNCIAANNRGYGFNTNDAGYDEICSMNIYNNIAYHNGYAGDWYWGYQAYGFIIFNTYASEQEELTRVFKNNIAYDNEAGPVYPYGGSYTHDHNTWDSSVTVTDSDFVSLDVSQLYAPRKADGSLPDITFGKLKSGSDMIDAGTNVGLPYSGSAPDLGPFEHAG